MELYPPSPVEAFPNFISVIEPIAGTAFQIRIPVVFPVMVFRVNVKSEKLAAAGSL